MGARGRRRGVSGGGARRKAAEVMVTNAPTGARAITFPGGAAAFRALVSARFCSAVWSHVSDCDEAFNYWEPLHYLVFGHGLQTWEYSSATGLRSYLSLWVFGGPAALLSYLMSPSASPPALLYLTRCLLALLAAAADLYFYKAVCREFGVHVARMWLAFNLTSAGGFVAGAAMLPSAWCASLVSLALGAWWKRNYPVAVLAVAAAALLGWPFTALLGLPIAIDLIFVQKSPAVFAQWTLAGFFLLSVPMIYVDSRYYGRLTMAPWNLIKYNIFTDHGPNLYGTEPWTFYFVNAFLNHNIIWLMALVCPILLIACEFIPNIKPRVAFCQPYWLSLMPLYSWLAVFILQPHKEERFLFPIYSMICLSGAIGVDCLQKLAFRIRPIITNAFDKLRGKKKTPEFIDKKQANLHYVSHTKYIMFFFITVSTLLGFSRSIALYHYYHGPMDILRGLAEEQVGTVGNINVCYGKEWHRFPSSFLFPDSRYRIGFVKSEFDGMLPAYYGSGKNATTLAPDHFNDMNKEDLRLYMNLTDCHYMVDSTIGSPTILEPRYSEDDKNWIVVKSIPFLDASKSNKLFRAFYIPIISEHYVIFGELQLLRSTKIKVN